MDPQTVSLLVQLGETTLPLVKASVTDVLAFAKAHGGTAETIAQLEANAQTIAQDVQTIDEELAADGAAEPDAAAGHEAVPEPNV